MTPPLAMILHSDDPSEVEPPTAVITGLTVQLNDPLVLSGETSQIHKAMS